MLAARALGDRAKLIEGTAETVALPAPDPDDKPKRPNKVMDAADTALGPKERKSRKRVPSPGQLLISQGLAVTSGGLRRYRGSPSTQVGQKRFLPQKGGSLSVEGVFAKKFSGAGEDSAVGAYVRLQS